MNINQKVLMWLSNGKVGASSKAMAFAAIGMPNTKMIPYDPADFNRCLLLIDEIPEIKERFDKISKLSPTWERLIARWDEIEKCFLEEVGFNWSHGKKAPKTYNLMQDIIGH